MNILPKEHSHCLFIDIQNYPTWHNFIDQILSCEMILSSSLHGIIVADAYGVPNLWCKFTDYEAPGKGFKFKDYYLSVGKSIKNPVHIQNMNLKEAEKLFSMNGINLLLTWTYFLKFVHSKVHH